MPPIGESKTLEALEESARNLAKASATYPPGLLNFFMMEMVIPSFLINTRLQVEHGVTELVHGIDLVEWMIQLSHGELNV